MKPSSLNTKPNDRAAEPFSVPAGRPAVLGQPEALLGKPATGRSEPAQTPSCNAERGTLEWAHRVVQQRARSGREPCEESLDRPEPRREQPWPIVSSDTPGGPNGSTHRTGRGGLL